MKKTLLFILIVIFAATPAFAAASKQGSISCTSTNTDTSLAGTSVKLINDGANSAFIRLNDTSAATTSDYELKINETLEISSELGINNVQCICNAAESATVRYISVK